jgi:hypothetical protein
MSEKKRTKRAKRAGAVIPDNIEAIWQREICGNQPLAPESFVDIAKWVYGRVPRAHRKGLAIDLMDIGYRLTE